MRRKQSAYLPKIGYVSYRNLRPVVGTPKNATVRLETDGWYVSIQCEFELKPKISIPDINTVVGIDMGVQRFLTLSDGSFLESLEERLRLLENKIALLHRQEERVIIPERTLKPKRD